MSAALIAQLLAAFGPAGIHLIEQLIAVWSKPALTVDEVRNLCAVARTSYDDYIAQAKANAGQV